MERAIFAGAGSFVTFVASTWATSQKSIVDIKKNLQETVFDVEKNLLTTRTELKDEFRHSLQNVKEELQTEIRDIREIPSRQPAELEGAVAARS